MGGPRVLTASQLASIGRRLISGQQRVCGLSSVREPGAAMVPAWGAQETVALDYDLPPERIALRPVSPRDSSRLLVYDHHHHDDHHHRGTTTTNGGMMRLRDLRFRDVERLLPSGTLVVVNHSRVITARLRMAKETSGAVEVLCVSPLEPSHDPALALRATSGQAVWRCLVGGKKIKPGMTLLIRPQPPPGEGGGGVGMMEDEEQLQFRAVVESRKGRDATLRFWWEGGSDFGSVLEGLGRVPLPPYMHRPDDDSDKDAYNTVYAREQGSVAAPTAGLHFTPELLSRLQHKDVHTCRLTLHVGAGTFQPVEAERVSDHHMHWERFHVQAAELDMLSRAVEAGRPIVPCGTTSVRTLESLYWSGVKLLVDDDGAREVDSNDGELRLGQWDAYRLEQAGAGQVPVAEALGALRRRLEGQGVGSISGETQLMIVPGYRFAMCDGLLTNFHQPRSTLLLLVGAVLGGMDAVHRLYDHALHHQPYRFLSFGDSSLLVLPQHTRRYGVRRPLDGLQLADGDGQEAQP